MYPRAAARPRSARALIPGLARIATGLIRCGNPENDSHPWGREIERVVDRDRSTGLKGRTGGGDGVSHRKVFR